MEPRIKDNNESSSTGGKWVPSAEQLAYLQHLFVEHGLRIPSTHQISEMTSFLKRYGRIEKKNIFYWFQNQKAQLKRNINNATMLQATNGSSTNTITYNRDATSDLGSLVMHGIAHTKEKREDRNVNVDDVEDILTIRGRRQWRRKMKFIWKDFLAPTTKKGLHTNPISTSNIEPSLTLSL